MTRDKVGCGCRLNYEIQDETLNSVNVMVSMATLNDGSWKLRRFVNSADAWLMSSYVTIKTHARTVSVNRH